MAGETLAIHAGASVIAMQRSASKVSYVLLCLFFFAAQPLHAASSPDQVTLLDGTVLKGQVALVQCEPGATRPQPTTLRFKGTTGSADISGRLVQTLVLSDGAVTLSAASPDKTIPPAVVAYLTASPGTRLALAASATTFNVSEALTLTCEAVTHFWNGDLAANGAWAIGTQTQKVIGGALLTSFVKDPTVYGWQYQIAKVDLEANYCSAKKEGSPALKSQELYYGDLNYSFHPSRKWSAFGMARLYHNFSLGLGLGQIYGAGVSYNSGGLVLAGALVGVTERFDSPGVPFTSAGARIFETYSHLLILGSTKIVFLESLDVIPAFDSSKAIQGRGITALKIPIGTRLAISPQYADDYLRNAPLNHRENYSRLSLGIDFKLGRSQ
jgi:uncharacterized protein DUF481